MKDWLEKTLEKARKQYGPIELKTIKGRHYLYKVTSVYDPEKKRARKISGEYLGRVTPEEGLIEPRRRVRSIHEYANAKLLSTLLDEATLSLRECFPDDWRELAALSIVKTTRNAPIKYAKDAWEKLHTSTEMEAHLSPNTVSEKLRAVGARLGGAETVLQEPHEGVRRVLLRPLIHLQPISEPQPRREGVQQGPPLPGPG